MKSNVLSERPVYFATSVPIRYIAKVLKQLWGTERSEALLLLQNLRLKNLTQLSMSTVICVCDAVLSSLHTGWVFPLPFLSPINLLYDDMIGLQLKLHITTATQDCFLLLLVWFFLCSSGWAKAFLRKISQRADPASAPVTMEKVYQWWKPWCTESQFNGLVHKYHRHIKIIWI